VVLYFFPGAYTQGCNIEAQAFAAKIADFKAAGAQVVGVTGGFGTSAKADPSKPYTSLNEAVADFSKSHCNGQFPVVAADAKIITDYGVPLTQRPGWSDRSSFVIDKNDKVVYAYSNLQPNDHITNTLKAVQDLKGK
jgi:peroxiredoxin